ncbi:MAG: carbamoyl-phosphate synthase (glutamine-hydrolyzing) large subunit [Bacteroidaceae bacterium]|nr:carbamoyl-phosphate synthase (glutamine-hydrolyzing) large subunit [Bacteroidaceae bacterium]
MKATLILEDGACFEGILFGATKAVQGEVVFNTAMMGYVENLQDPANTGQILVCTYPIIGNYGVPSKEVMLDEDLGLFDSDHIHASALIVSDLSDYYSHWSAVETLESWMVREGVPGIRCIDTRALTQYLREHGTMRGQIVMEGEEIQPIDFAENNDVAAVSHPEAKHFAPKEKANGKHAVVVDFGCTAGLIVALREQGYEVTRVPYDAPFDMMEADALWLSNGPGNPLLCPETISHIAAMLQGEKPVVGIGLGCQFLALAAGAQLMALPYGHRGHNHAIRRLADNHCYISTQNHGYAVDASTLPEGWSVTFENIHDGSCEGIRCDGKPFYGFQFCPETKSGALDWEAIFAMANGEWPTEPVRSCQGGLRLPKKVLLLGSGALKIGEAGEFDYSGSQALKAMREQGVQTVLINPNIATVQTSEGVADKVYFLPVTPYFVERVIQKEQPDAILLAFGGQTALNCGVQLFKSGVLDKYNVRVLGTPVQTIIDTEDRELFNERLAEINVNTIKSEAVETMDDAKRAARELGYPVIIRSAYALGGLGSGFCDNEEELVRLAEKSFSFSPQILVEKSLKGWKEIEFEVVRDGYNNCITVCSMENFDPLGIHTGESIVIAPAQSLTNKDVTKLHELSIRIVRHLGIVGECNIQFAYDPMSEEYFVIEVNARLSRSSALASKATGYPLAAVAAKIGLGYGLWEIRNAVTRTTSAFFEPSVDYVVGKFPRWDLGKFHGVDREIGSSMKSVGEVMSIGRSFEEVIQKGLRMIGQGMHGFVENRELVIPDLDKALREPTDKRIYVISKALRAGYSVDKIYELTKIDRWFLYKLEGIMQTSRELHACGGLENLSDELLMKAKRQGFSDFQLSRALGLETSLGNHEGLLAVRAERKRRGILPVVKQIDTVAGEVPAQINYLYLTYNGTKHDVEFFHDDRGIIVLGSGAYRIGSSVEFDWCSVQALNTVRKEGFRNIVINYNPETVSTDYDVTDRLYFDELSFERVMDIIELEAPRGVILSTGGQIPNNLALRLDAQRVPILGTSAQDIDHAEDREKFSAMLDSIGVDQPEWSELTSLQDINGFAERVGFPVLVRPSYVLSGAAMNVCSNPEELERFLQLAADVSKDHPVVVSKFIEGAKEVEMDAVARDGEIIAYAISEHIEFAGVHSGDATIQFPPQKLYVETVRRIKRISRQIAKELHISGPFNIQYLARDNDIKVIECNLRASRSFPFVSKVLKINLIELATRVMLGLPVERLEKSLFDLDYVGIKASQFSFNRLQKADPVLGVDMASTGEVGCLGDDSSVAILASMLSVGQRIPAKNILLSTGTARQKAAMLDAAKLLRAHGYNIFATGGTSRFLAENGVENTLVHWPSEPDQQPQALDMLHRKEIDMVVNIPKNLSTGELTNGYKIRRAAIDLNIPLITNARLADAFIRAFCTLTVDDIPIKSWDEY